LGLEVRSDALSQNGDGGGFDVFDRDGEASVHRGERFAAVNEILSGAGAGAPVDEVADEVGRGLVVGPRGADETRRVLHDVLAHSDARDELLHIEENLRVEELARLGGLASGRRGEDALLFLKRRIVDLDVEHEAVELRFRERIRSLLVDRVLRRDDEERLRKRPRLVSDRDLALLHRLKERRLRLRRRAVDFVREQNVRKDRTLHESERTPTLPVFLEHRRARDVRRRQVGRKLDALELHVENLRERRDGQRLREPGNPLQKTVPARKDGGENLTNHVLLPDDDLRQLVLDRDSSLSELLKERAEIARAPLRLQFLRRLRRLRTLRLRSGFFKTFRRHDMRSS